MANGGIIGTVNNPTSSTATGVWQQEEQYEAKVTDTWPERALFTTKSLRFNSASSDRLNRTLGTPTNNLKWTYSFWIKRSKLGEEVAITEAINNSQNKALILFRSDDQLEILDLQSDSYVMQKKTNRKFRDVSAWYHIVFSNDSTAGSPDLKIYVNGVEETSFATDNEYSQNQASLFNSALANHIGASASSRFSNCYFSEFILIDGQALTPTSFGVTNSDGVWTPIPYSGSFGTNGFNLQFENSAALGTDSSPNGNTFTVNNLTSIDQSTDYPVVNYATGNPLLNYNPQLTEGNLLLTSSGTAWKNSMSTIGLTSGIWYHEVKIIAESSVPYGLIGVTDSYHPNSWGASPPNYVGVGALQIGYFNNNGTYYKSDSQNSYGASFTVNDTIGVLLNLDAGTPTIKFYKNDADQGSINLPTSSNSTGLWFFMQSVYIQTMSVNYGSPAHAISSGNQDGNGYGNFEYATKGGYTLNTANLAEFG